VKNSITVNDIFDFRSLPQRRILGGIILLLIFQLAVFAQTQISTPDEKTLIVDDAPEMEVFSFGKTVIVKKHAKGVLSFGGDVIVEGKVDGEVATVGGSITQKETAEIGGDVIVFGGTYRPESAKPLRTEGKETIVFGVFEQEFRDLTQNPSQIFSPSFSLGFLAQRLLSILFWFVVSLAFTTIAPGAISRAVARFQLSTLKVFAIGFSAFVFTMILAIGSLSVLPNFFSAVIGLMVFVLLFLAYFFGRVALQVSIGKMMQKHLFSEKSQSETLAIFIGVFILTLLLSIPYLWTIALLALFSAGIGLVLTARISNGWQKN
jgi:hypothetical protein